jgi:hypothetical protein
LGAAGERFDAQLRQISNLASGGPVKILQDLIAELGAEPSSLINALAQNGFGPRTAEPARRLWEAFVEATADQTDVTEPWTLLRDFAMGLGRSGHHAAASALIRGLIWQGQATAVPRETMVILPYDLSLIEGQRHAQPIENPPPEPAVYPPAEPEAHPAAEPEAQPRPDTQAAVQATSRRRRRLLRGLRLAGVALAATAVVFVQLPTLPWQPVSNLPVLAGVIDTEETVPPVGAGQRYPLPYVRYCHYQAERLKAIKDLAQGPEDARAFNLLVVDYNSRCSDFLYQPQDLVAVVAAVSANKSRFEADAKRIMSEWPGHSAEQH